MCTPAKIHKHKKVLHTRKMEEIQKKGEKNNSKKNQIRK